MSKVVYISNVSLDGFIEDAAGNFDFSEPSDEVFTFITDLIRDTGTFVYGRRLYESMAVWETDPALAQQSELYAEFARVWQAADKVVYSATLKDVATARTKVERHFDADALRAMKDAAARDFTIGGAELTAHALAAGLVDEIQLFVSPVLLGTGKASLPRDRRIALELLDERRFGNGAVYLRYGVIP